MAAEVQTHLIGAGIVGEAIFHAHLDARVPVVLADLDEANLDHAINSISDCDAKIERASFCEGKIPAVKVNFDSAFNANARQLVIESVSEKLAVKQSLFADLERHFPEDTILCSNTSTLRIADIAATLATPERFCGMHFFMPVSQRHAVEIIRHDGSAPDVIATCSDHAARIRKTPLHVGDSPGFIVNRLLSPYLNQSLLLLAHGVSAMRIERAALDYGMPFSPLELIDWIGTRTMFDAGRVFWQAFPNRIDPSPIVPALIKLKRAGRACGHGLYDYESGIRSRDLAEETKQAVAKYQLEALDLTDESLVHLLAIPMWIESQIMLEQGITKSTHDFDIAMQGGLGYTASSWNGFFQELTKPTIEAAIQEWSFCFKSMKHD